MLTEKKFPIFLKVLCERQPTTVIVLKQIIKNGERVLLLHNRFEFNKFNKLFEKQFWAKETADNCWNLERFGTNTIGHICF